MAPKCRKINLEAYQEIQLSHIVKIVRQKLMTSLTPGNNCQFESFILPLLQMFLVVPISRTLYY